jgi:cation diffusion facilitator CzcD-associated flavoprotein CzcO
MATGPLSEAVVPHLPGLGSFQGRAFHSARWDHACDLTNRRVAVIGTGASAIQFIPEIQPRVSQLYVFQRTPAWVIPRPDAPISTTRRDLYRRHPHLQRLARLLVYATREWRFLLFRHPGVMRLFEKLARRYLAMAISDPVLRDKLTPTYRMGCKRILLSSDYYPAMAQSNVELVTAAVSEVRPHSIVDADGVERPVDVIIFGTGFRPTDPPLAAHIRGRDGHTLQDLWRGSPHAHLGTTLAGFPNLFFLLGPNTGLGHNSVVYMTEAQIDHLLHALHYMARHHLDALEPRAEAQQAFVADVDRRMQGTVWVSGGCRSWYLDGTGRNSALWPGSSFSFYRRVANFRPGEYVHA